VPLREVLGDDENDGGDQRRDEADLQLPGAVPPIIMAREKVSSGNRVARKA
jgi:hypothetical protein